MAKKAKTETKADAKRMELSALGYLSGKYYLPYSPGQMFTIDAKRGQELIDNKDAEIVK